MTLRTLLALAFCAASLFATPLVAHRGASADAPENTLAAFRLAFARGADAIEGDFRLTRDKRIVCMHDATTKRTAGVDKTVANATLAELRKLDVGGGERIPTLEEVLPLIPRGKHLVLEIKCGVEIVTHLKRALAETPSERVVVIAFDEDVLRAAKRKMPRFKTRLLVRFKRGKPSLQEITAMRKRCRADELGVPGDRVVDEAFLRDAGCPVHVWTINDAIDANRWHALGVASITTDRPKFIRDRLVTPGLQAHLKVHLPCDGKLDGAGVKGDVEYVPGVFGQALKGVVAISQRLPDTGSLCLWYRTARWYDYQTVFDNTAHQDEWEMWIYKSGKLRFRNRHGGASVTFDFHPTADVNEWHHLAVTWDRERKSHDAVRLYVNGRLADEARWRKGWVKPGDVFYLGGGHEKNTKGKGAWDDVALYDVVLAPADIRRIMRSGVAAR